tara:strand:- start:342 stop:530 length:189 start_codon:yes stop_codon:yes gene_type:complete
MRNTLTLAAILFTAFLAAGCENDGPAERAGEAIDNTATDVGNAIEDACEDVKEGAGADDTDC